MMTKYLTANVQLLLVFSSFVLLAFLVGAERMKRVSLAVIVALYVDLMLGEVIFSFLTRFRLSFINKSIVLIVLFIAITLLLSLGKVESGRHKGISIPALILAILTAGMLISAGVDFMPTHIKSQLVTDYNLYALVVSAKYWWLGLTVAWIIVMNLWHRPEKKK